MAHLFADEDFPLETVRALRRLGHDVLTTREAGLAGIGTADPDILQAATATDRAVLTQNRRHFMRLHMHQPGHAGIVVCTADPDFERQAQRIHRAIAAHGVLAGLLIRVNRPSPAEDSA
jgi:Domain of unknown function (DUF5615)